MRRFGRAMLVLALCLPLGLAVLIAHPQSKSAAVAASNWQSGNIISDAIFYDSTALNAIQVQTFLNSMYTGCSSGYTCIRDYHVTTPSRTAEANLCKGYTGAANQSAAQIIAAVAVTCGVNPQSLLALIQKESGIITSHSPTYTQVTGYGCPDSTGCDAHYYGFFNQVYLAARQFKLYRLNPTQYGYVAGRSNFILYNPRTSCGGSNVFIVNQATAGLYDYTPYQPNAAALANLTGTGDGCSAYGNRNFWYFFNTWFGSTQGPSGLLRTAANPTVYLVRAGRKNAVDNIDTLQALPATFGRVQRVDQGYLDQQQTGPTLGRMVRRSDGSVYFFDAQTIMHVPTCAMVADFGYSCPNTVPLVDTDVVLFKSGPDLTTVAKTTSGRRYLVTHGTKREVLDDQSLAGVNAPPGTVTLTDASIASLSVAAPVVRDGVAIGNRANGSDALYSGGSLFPIATDLYAKSAVATAYPIAGHLDPASLALLTAAPALTGFALDGTGQAYVVAASGKYPIASPVGWGVGFSTWPTAVLNALTTLPTATTPPLVKAASSPATYAVGNNAKFPISAWSTATAITHSSAPVVLVLLDQELAAIPTGPHPLLVPGTLAKSRTDPSIYLIDGFGTKVHLQSFATANGLGLNSYTPVDATVLNAYAAAPGAVSPAVTCSSVNELAYGGTLRPIDASQQAYYDLTFESLDPVTCRGLPLPSGASLTTPIYVKATTSATVYQLSSGSRRPVASMAALITANNGTTPPVATFADGQLDAIPVGPTIG